MNIFFHLCFFFPFLLTYWKDTEDENLRKVVLLINWKETGGLALSEADARNTMHFPKGLEEALTHQSPAQILLPCTGEHWSPKQMQSLGDWSWEFRGPDPGHGIEAPLREFSGAEPS